MSNMEAIQAKEDDLKGYHIQLEGVTLQLQANPGDENLQGYKNDLEELISITEDELVALQAAAPAPVSAPVANPVKEKWSKEDHPAYKAGYRPPGTEPEELQHTQTVFNVNDRVLARWKSGDGSFYAARIISKTGSSASPVYSVRFLDYSGTETCYGKDVRPIPNNEKKRKADVVSGENSAIKNSGVISAASTVDPNLAQAPKYEPSKVSDGPPKPAKAPRKARAKNELNDSKNKWQSFQAKTKKVGKKDSMFRTGDSVTARVGFTGSGNQMRKDPTRSKHIYQQDVED